MKRSAQITDPLDRLADGCGEGTRERPELVNEAMSKSLSLKLDSVTGPSASPPFRGQVDGSRLGEEFSDRRDARHSFHSEDQ
jgi:hypothetical protein